MSAVPVSVFCSAVMCSTSFFFIIIFKQMKNCSASDQIFPHKWLFPLSCGLFGQYSPYLGYISSCSENIIGIILLLLTGELGADDKWGFSSLFAF